MFMTVSKMCAGNSVHIKDKLLRQYAVILSVCIRLVKVSSIAKRLKCSRVTIHKLLNRKKATGSVKDKKRSGRPRKTNKKDDHVLK